MYFIAQLLNVYNNKNSHEEYDNVGVTFVTCHINLIKRSSIWQDSLKTTYVFRSYICNNRYTFSSFAYFQSSSWKTFVFFCGSKNPSILILLFNKDKQHDFSDFNDPFPETITRRKDKLCNAMVSLQKCSGGQRTFSFLSSLLRIIFLVLYKVLVPYNTILSSELTILYSTTKKKIHFLKSKAISIIKYVHNEWVPCPPTRCIVI